MGIPEEGTTDYRNVALQFRYEYSAKDAFVIQFSDERRRVCLLAGFDPDVKVLSVN